MKTNWNFVVGSSFFYIYCVLFFALSFSYLMWFKNVEESFKPIIKSYIYFENNFYEFLIFGS